MAIDGNNLPESALSQHPVDVLIRDLIRSRRSATTDEIARIIERMATAPFDQRLTPVPIRMRGLTYLQHTLAAREHSLVYHLVKRVIAERQWAMGTTATQYVADLSRAVRQSAPRLAIYVRRGGTIAATLTATAAVLPSERRGANALSELLVIYSVDRGIILSGYQVSGLEQTGIPGEAQWLR